MNDQTNQTEDREQRMLRETGFDGAVDSEQLAEEAKNPPKWLVQGLIVANEPLVLGGPPKSLKTGIAIDLAVSLAGGQKFLGHFSTTYSAKVGIMSGESGKTTLYDTADRIARERGLPTIPKDIIWWSSVPKLDHKDFGKALELMLSRYELKMLIIDPSSPCVSEADRNLPLTRQRAILLPFLLIISHPTGTDRVVTFLNIDPMIPIPFRMQAMRTPKLDVRFI